MVQSLSASQSGLGSVNKVGTTPEGRGIYQISTPDGQAAGKLSVAAKDCDVFERSFNEITEIAPKVQAWQEKTTPDEIKKMQNKSKWTIIGTSAIGGLIPACIIKGKPWISALTAVAGAVGGFLLGSYISAKSFTPAELTEFSKATQRMSKLDIKPVN